MRLNRSYLFIIISSLALIVVLCIQVNWIFETARIKEELFNEKANMVLSKTVEDINLDKEESLSVGACSGRNEMDEIDSALSANMAFYHFYLDYSFEIIPPGEHPLPMSAGVGSQIPDAEKTTGDNVYTKRLNELANEDGTELQLIFPGKAEFVRAEMGTLFFTSVLLILIVLVLSWRTIMSLIRQQKIAQHNTDFLKNMTHELKTPLTNIGLAGRMIIKDVNITQEDKIRHYSSIILAENEKLRLQVEQVLSLGALERGEIPLQKTEVDLHEVINESLEVINVQIENKQGEVRTDLAAKKTKLNGDKAHITNAISNLVDNAIKYARQKPDISIQTSDENEHLKIVIADKGIGIDKKYRSKVFNQFFRVPTGDVHNVKGFGMGLSYTKMVIELHGGTIALSGEKGVGTTFTILLPNG